MIKCLVCNTEEMIAKYYPSTGWYFECIPYLRKKVKIDSTDSTQEEINDYSKEDAFNDFFDKHHHGKHGSFEGSTHFELKFELE